MSDEECVQRYMTSSGVKAGVKAAGPVSFIAFQSNYSSQ